MDARDLERPGAPVVRRLRAAVAAALLAGLGLAPVTHGAVDPALERYAPVLVSAAREVSGPVAVEVVPGVRRLRAGAEVLRVPSELRVPSQARGVVYGRVAPARGGGRWLQYWRFHLDNPQDRGVVRTGRHEGDWELTQVFLDSAERPREAVYAQHSGAERCGWRVVERLAGHPVAYLARGSHAAYFRPGVRDRTFPDPNDEADGGGAAIRARVVAVSADAPAWMRWPGRWGGSERRLPFEQSSPRGPAFQPDGRWSDPDDVADRARPCAADRCDEEDECDDLEVGGLAGIGIALGAAAAGGWALRRRRRRVP